MTGGMQRYFLCHYHEIALKGKNRAFFEDQLCRNIQLALEGLPIEAVRRFYGRILVKLRGDSPLKEIERRLSCVFGIASLSPAWECKPDLQVIRKELWELVREIPFDTFKIHARRANKSFPLTSPEINRQVGNYIGEKSGKTVQLNGPDLTCYIHIVNQFAFLYFSKTRGAGGLPVGSAGKVIALVSGGIDSPVAAYKIIRRGCRAIFVHFHSYPHTSRESQDKVRQLVTLLCNYQYSAQLYLVPFAEAQRRIVALTPSHTRVILYRRLMMRIAERIGIQSGAQALVTGDSIGQVASQTLENIRVISRVVEMPVFRPLIGEDKEDIIRSAESIGSFAISILPDEDCCSLFVPRHPETRASAGAIETIEKQLDIETIINDALVRTEKEKIGAQFSSESVRSDVLNGPLVIG